MQRTCQQTKPNGFTLVEMLVIAPIMVLVIATLIGFMISLVGDVLIANSRIQALYDIQDALNQIEQDTFFSTGFLGSYTPTAPQGRNNDTTAFTYTTGNGISNSIILDQPGTDKNPADNARQLVYYANQPESCAGQVQINKVLYTKTIYFVQSGALYRRIIVPANASTACTPPWQRNTCASINQGGYALCVAKDAKLLTNVSALNITYFNKSNPSSPITEPSLADSIKVSITTSATVSGSTTSNTLELNASRTNR